MYQRKDNIYALFFRGEEMEEEATQPDSSVKNFALLKLPI